MALGEDDPLFPDVEPKLFHRRLDAVTQGLDDAGALIEKGDAREIFNNGIPSARDMNERIELL